VWLDTATFTHMGRFSAYTDDSDNSDEQSLQSSEDELEVVLEDEGEYEERSPSPTPPSSSSPPPEPEPQPELQLPPPEPRPSQTVPWPQQVGVDPQRVHVMQASLFHASADVQDLTVAHPQLLVPKLNSRKHSRGAESDLLREVIVHFKGKKRSRLNVVFHTETFVRTTCHQTPR
jgi:nuclear pore complex protein Nup98-Nup96